MDVAFCPMNATRGAKLGAKITMPKAEGFFFILCEPSGAVVGQNATLMFLFYPILHLCKPLHFQKSDKYWHEQKRAFIPVTSWWYPLYARQTTIKLHPAMFLKLSYISKLLMLTLPSSALAFEVFQWWLLMDWWLLGVRTSVATKYIYIYTKHIMWL